MIWREARRSWIGFGLSCAVTAIAVAVCVAMAHVTDAQLRQVQRLTRDMGFNLRIIPRQADELEFYQLGYTPATMPQSVIDRLLEQKTMYFEHLVATLQDRVSWPDGRTAILVGVAPSVSPSGKAAGAMQYEIPAGQVELGRFLADSWNVRVGQTLELFGEEVTVRTVSSERGTLEAIKIYGNLTQVQAWLDKPGQINEVRAIDCLCLTDDHDPQGILEAELERLLPEARVLMMTKLADARARQRLSSQRLASMLMPGSVLASGLMVFGLALANAFQRRHEISMLRAVGFAQRQVMGLVLGRSALAGWIGGVLGWTLAMWLLVEFVSARWLLPISWADMQWGWWWGAWWLTPVLTAVASFGPAVWASTQDPARGLTEG